VFGLFRGSNFGCLPVRVRTQTGGFAALGILVFYLVHTRAQPLEARHHGRAEKGRT
jgi:hypothetical protein